jgi:hypothetical protein
VLGEQCYASGHEPDAYFFNAESRIEKEWLFFEAATLFSSGLLQEPLTLKIYH